MVVVFPRGAGPCLSPPSLCALTSPIPQGGQAASPLSPGGRVKVPLHDDWTHEVGHRCPALKRPSSPMFIDVAQLETAPWTGLQHAPTYSAAKSRPETIDSTEQIIRGLQPILASTNHNVMKYKYIPSAADGESGVRYRKFLDMKNARESRRKARRIHEAEAQHSQSTMVSTAARGGNIFHASRSYHPANPFQE